MENENSYIDEVADGFRGNSLLKKPNTKIDFTEEQVVEYYKCSQDPVHFISSYVKIVNVDTGLVLFPIWDFQKNMVDVFDANRFSICKLPRQVGKTTTVVAYLLWKILFSPELVIAILAHKAEQAQDILAKLQLAYMYLPLWMQQGIITWNKRSIELENGSKIRASSTASTAIRGGSYNIIYLDEFAHVPEHIASEFFASVYPTISSGKTTKVIITSTPKGLNLFYKLWSDAETGKNSYVPVSIHWSDVPGRDDAWRLETIRNTSEEQFNQEHGCEFLGSVNTLISAKKLATMTYIEPIYQTQDLRIFEQPEKGRSYLMVVDSSRGSNLDYSAFIIYEISQIPYRVVATYRNNTIASYLYPTVIYEVAKKFYDAWILVETNDIGQQVADILLHEFEYENLLKSTQSGKKGQFLSAGFGQATKLGVRTTQPVKRIGCSNLKALIEENKLITNDYNILYEISRFISKGNSFEAEEGSTDDLAMCCVLFAWAINQDFIKDITNVDLRKSINMDNEKFIEEELTPFGFMENGDEDDFETIREIPGSEFDKWMLS